MAAAPSLPAGTSTASNMIDGVLVKVTSTSICRFDALITVPSRGPTTLHCAPAASMASRIGLSDAESTPSATRIATLRVLIEPSPVSSMLSARDSSTCDATR